MKRTCVSAVRRTVLCAALACGLMVTALMHTSNAELTRGTVSPTVPPNFHTVEVKKGGFSIAVPNTWLALDPKSKSFNEMLVASAKADPDLAPTLDQFKTVAPYALFLAADQSAATYSSDLLVLQLPIARSELSHPSDVQTVLESAFAGKLSDLTTRTIKVADTKSLIASGNLPVTALDGSQVTAYLTALLVPTRDGVLDFTFGTAAPGDQDSTLQAMIQSLKLLR